MSRDGQEQPSYRWAEHPCPAGGRININEINEHRCGGRVSGSLEVGATVSLADTDVGAGVRISRVIAQDAERVRYISGLGLVPGAEIEVTGKAPFDGPMSVRLGHTVRVVDQRLARMILVER